MMPALGQRKAPPDVAEAQRIAAIENPVIRNLEITECYAQLAAGITPIRRVYDLRHTFATFALRAGVSTFDLSRYMGASLTMIDRHYGHLARDGRDHAIDLLDTQASADEGGVHRVDIAWTLHQQAVATTASGNSS